jgi:hypothetical protein
MPRVQNHDFEIFILPPVAVFETEQVLSNAKNGNPVPDPALSGD